MDSGGQSEWTENPNYQPEPEPEYLPPGLSQRGGFAGGGDDFDPARDMPRNWHDKNGFIQNGPLRDGRVEWPEEEPFEQRYATGREATKSNKGMGCIFLSAAVIVIIAMVVCIHVITGGTLFGLIGTPLSFEAPTYTPPRTCENVNGDGTVGDQFNCSAPRWSAFSEQLEPVGGNPALVSPASTPCARGELCSPEACCVDLGSACAWVLGRPRLDRAGGVETQLADTATADECHALATASTDPSFDGVRFGRANSTVVSGHCYGEQSWAEPSVFEVAADGRPRDISDYWQTCSL